MLNPFQESKKIIQLFKKGLKIRWLPISTNNHAQHFIKWYAILKSVLSLLKQTVLIKMYVFITSKYVNSDNLCIYGFPGAIFKMSANKPNFGFSIIQLRFVSN